MKLKKSIALVAMGIGGTLLYQQIRNGNAKNCINNMEKFVKKTYGEMYDELEDMM